MQLAPYIFFDRQCEEALNFYKQVFGGEIKELNRVGDGPPHGDPDPSRANLIMHSTFEAPGITFMAADGSEDSKGETRRVSLALASPDAEEGRRVFEALGAGGTIDVPYEKQFWGASFGMVTDRFGVSWMVNAGGG